MTKNLKDKTISGLTWSSIDNIASQGITFLIGIILARILSPTEFGTLGIAMVFVGLFNKIVDCGFSAALIRKQNISSIDYNTSFIFNISVSVILYLLCVLLSPYIGKFFNNYELNKVLRWMSLVIIINGVGIIQRTRLIKKIDFKTQTKISLISSIISGVIGISSAYFNQGVMSLVYQQLSRQILSTSLLWGYNKWLPKLEFSITSFKEQFSYGSKLLFSGLIDYVFNEAATIVIGRVHSPATLGQYSRAKQFSSIFSSNLSSIIERVTFPVLAEFQANKNILAFQYKRMVKCMILVSGISMVTLACTADSLVLILLGDKWVESIKYLQIVCFIDIFYPIKSLNLNAIKVSGKTDYILKLSLVKRIIEAIPILLGIFNIYYMLYGLIITSIIGFMLNAYFAAKCIPYAFKEQLVDCIRPLFTCLVPGIFMLFIKIFNFNIVIQFMLQLFVGILVFYIMVRVINKSEYDYIKNTLFSIFKIKNQ